MHSLSSSRWRPARRLRELNGHLADGTHPSDSDNHTHTTYPYLIDSGSIEINTFINNQDVIIIILAVSSFLEITRRKRLSYLTYINENREIPHDSVTVLECEHRRKSQTL